MYLLIKCDSQISEVAEFTLNEVKSALVWSDEIPRNLKFWNEFVPELITWLSAEAIQCGIYTIFAETRHEIYRFINDNRSNWVNMLQELVHILLQVVAVIHHKTGEFARFNVYEPERGKFPRSNYYEMNWVDKWVLCYEFWYTHYDLFYKTSYAHDAGRDPLQYFETLILRSFDIVIAWMVDYLGQRAGARETPQPNFCKLLNNCTLPFQRNLYDQAQWNLNGVTSETKCALRKSDTLNILDAAYPYNWLLEALDPSDRIKAMAHAFVTCSYDPNKGVCKTSPSSQPHKLDNENVYVYIGLKNGSNGYDTVVGVPGMDGKCKVTCSKLPGEFQHNEYAVTAEHLNKYALSHAHMTTSLGFEFRCNIRDVTILKEHNGVSKVSTKCQPQIVAKYLYKREYKICCKNKCKNAINWKENENKIPCCPRGYYEVVTVMTRQYKMKYAWNLTLNVNNETFPDLENL